MEGLDSGMAHRHCRPRLMSPNGEHIICSNQLVHQDLLPVLSLVANKHFPCNASLL